MTFWWVIYDEDDPYQEAIVVGKAETLDQAKQGCRRDTAGIRIKHKVHKICRSFSGQREVHISKGSKAKTWRRFV